MCGIDNNTSHPNTKQLLEGLPKNWGKWGPDDQVGTLNYITPQNIIDASRLVKKGKVFSLGLNFDRTGPQKGLWGNRFNPIHTMLATGKGDGK